MEKLEAILKALGLFEKVFKTKAQKQDVSFTWREQDLAPCNTRILREGRGWKWNNQVGLHTRLDGTFEMIRIEAPKVEKPKKLSPPDGPIHPR